MSFVHLHVHSHYSILSALPQIDDLVKKAKKEGMNALALTDLGNMYGVIEFYQACTKAGIKPIIGEEFYVAPQGRKSKRARMDEEVFRIVLLARNEEGYKNLIQLTTKAHLEGFFEKPRIDHELLQQYAAGLICLSGGVSGELGNAVKLQDPKKIASVMEFYKRVFGEFFFLEVQHHPGVPQQGLLNTQIFSLSQQYGVPVVAAHDVYYLESSEREAHDVLICLGTKHKLEDTDRFSMMDDDYSFTSEAQMRTVFADHPEVVDQTQKIADLCDVKIELGKHKLPFFPVPSGYTPETFLQKKCEEGVCVRFGVKTYLEASKEVLDRLNYELSVIFKTGFASYFLIVSDFVNWAKEAGIVVGPGRGSAAGSLVAYLMNITDVEPIAYDLLFERFLNPERISMPDIDMDFADTRRDEVLQYVRKKYGEDHVCQIITFGTLAARAALRDTGRVLGFPYMYCDELSKMIPMKLSLSEAIAQVPELKARYDMDTQAHRLLDMAQKLEGVARHTSTHACGVVIAKDSLDTYMPYQYSVTDNTSIVSQYSLHPVEDLGLLKMDFLGLKNLSLMEETLYWIKKNHGKEIFIDKLPLDDPKTYELFCAGQTTGVFQFESSGMKRYLKQLRPSNIEDLVAMVALYRPGPMEWIPKYIAGKHGAQLTYLHPKLKPILDKTYGVAVYQEQVMQMAKSLAGFSMGEADVLRKAMGKKIAELLAQQKVKFIEGCVRNGIDESVATNIFSFIEPFAGYGFNRSHAVCYAFIAYQTGFLKANYPVEFMTALLNSDQNDLDRVAIEVEECRSLGISVLPADINESGLDFMPSGNGIRFCLKAIKNLGEHVASALVADREKQGKFQNLQDVLIRVQDRDMNKKALESLIKSGALDGFGDRAVLLHNLEKLLSYHKNVSREIMGKQSNLFGVLGTPVHAPLVLDEVTHASQKQKLGWEKEFLGVYLSAHPFDEYASSVETYVTSIGRLPLVPRGMMVRVAGVLCAVKKIMTKNNETMFFARLEDTSGALEVIVFPKTLKKTAPVWVEDAVVMIIGKLSFKDEEMKLLVEDAKVLTLQNVGLLASTLISKDKRSPLFSPQGMVTSVSVEDLKPQEPVKEVSVVYIDLSYATPDVCKKLETVLKSGEGTQKVFLRLTQNGESKTIETPYVLSSKHHAQIEDILGPNRISF